MSEWLQLCLWKSFGFLDLQCTTHTPLLRFNPTKGILIKMPSWVDSPGAEPEVDTPLRVIHHAVISQETSEREARWGRDRKD